MPGLPRFPRRRRSLVSGRRVKGGEAITGNAAKLRIWRVAAVEDGVRGHSDVLRHHMERAKGIEPS